MVKKYNVEVWYTIKETHDITAPNEDSACEQSKHIAKENEPYNLVDTEWSVYEVIIDGAYPVTN